VLDRTSLYRAVKPLGAGVSGSCRGSQYLATGRDAEAYGYFRERAAAAPDHAIFVALEGMFHSPSPRKKHLSL